MDSNDSAAVKNLKLSDAEIREKVQKQLRETKAWLDARPVAPTTPTVTPFGIVVDLLTATAAACDRIHQLECQATDPAQRGGMATEEAALAEQLWAEKKDNFNNR